jgi:hypothetical protein
VTGTGTGSNTEVTGTGTGANTEVTGTGTGSNTEVTGTGTGSHTQVTGTGTGSKILVTGTGTGTEALTVTLPNGTGMSMEVSLGCGTAEVSILDEQGVPIVTFDDVSIIGKAAVCNLEFGTAFLTHPGKDFWSD